MSLLSRIKDWLLPEPKSTDAIALNNFIRNVYYGETLSSAKAISQLERGIVEFQHHRQHSSNGLLISCNGYVVTAYHCVDDRIPPTARLYNGQSYYVERVCARSEKQDMALVKINLAGSAHAIKYKLFTEPLLYSKQIPLVVLSRWDGVIAKKGGYFKQDNYEYKSFSSPTELKKHIAHILIEAETIQGDSGGIVSNSEGRIVGIVSAGSEANKQVATQYTMASKFTQCLELVSLYARTLDEREKKK